MVGGGGGRDVNTTHIENYRAPLRTTLVHKAEPVIVIDSLVYYNPVPQICDLEHMAETETKISVKVNMS